jgi:hypothetical protein
MPRDQPTAETSFRFRLNVGTSGRVPVSFGVPDWAGPEPYFHPGSQNAFATRQPVKEQREIAIPEPLPNWRER